MTVVGLSEQRVGQVCQTGTGNRRVTRIALLAVVAALSSVVICGSGLFAQGVAQPPAPAREFRDCDQCPAMVAIPAGSANIGPSRFEERLVKFARPFAIGKYEITFSEWDACHAAGGCKHRPSDNGHGRGRRPVNLVSWYDAQEYATWLSKLTGQRYRLLSEAEWEYVARAGVVDGQRVPPDQGPSRHPYRQSVEQSKPNIFGVYGMHGGASEMVEDCYHDDDANAPVDGSAWTVDCVKNTPQYDPVIDSFRKFRGSVEFGPSIRQIAINSGRFHPGLRNILNRGFRIAKSLDSAP